MADPKPETLVKAKWLGGPVTIPVLGVSAEYGTEVEGVPKGEAEESDNWEYPIKKGKGDS